jgi:2'-hydroxyisoflavone reductase
MKILIIGGTLFLGRHIVESALGNGHEVTLFNRGKRNTDLFPGVEKIKGDRDSDLELLKGRKWDAVIDTCGYIPRIVEKSAQALSENAGTYVFISSISVYKDFSKAGINEEADLLQLENEADETLTNETYGALKTHCEERVLKHFPSNSLIIRPGLIVGPHDYTDRFTYWPVRVKRGGQVIIPDHTDYPIQFIDVRDLADLALRLVESKVTGIFNATGPENEFTFKQLLDACLPFAEKNVEFIGLPEEFLEESLNENGTYLPMSEAKGEWAGIEQVNCSKAIGHGLAFRDVKETVKNTLEWFGTLPENYEMKTGLKPEIEKKIIEKWKNK